MKHRLQPFGLLFAFLLLAGACTGGGEETDDLTGDGDAAAEDPFVEVTGPLVAMVPAGSIDEEGLPVDPALTFSPDAPG